MFFSIVICTVRRAEVIDALIQRLHAQSWRSAEILVVAGPAQEEIHLPAADDKLSLSFYTAPRGLAPARNVGLAKAKGDIVCFLDDDVLMGPEFLSTAAAIFQRPEHQDVGGITGFDTLNYSGAPDMRWRFRYWLGTAPSLQPGDATHLGRSVPLSFLAPFSGCREVKWLPGFCQMFRRTAIGALQYDEKIIVEDRDFSMNVGDSWRLLVSGDLRLQHLRDGEARQPNHLQTWKASFGLGRSFAKRWRSSWDWLSFAHVVVAELFIDCLVAARRPSLINVRVPLFRLKGFVQGLLSFREGAS